MVAVSCVHPRPDRASGHMWEARCLCRCRQHSRTVPGLPTGSCRCLAERWAGTGMGCVWKLPDAWAAVAPLVEELRDDCIFGAVAENPRGPQKRPWHLDVDGLLWASGTQVMSVLLGGPGRPEAAFQFSVIRKGWLLRRYVWGQSPSWRRKGLGNKRLETGAGEGWS